MYTFLFKSNQRMCQSDAWMHLLTWLKLIVCHKINFYSAKIVIKSTHNQSCGEYPKPKLWRVPTTKVVEKNNNKHHLLQMQQPYLDIYIIIILLGQINKHSKYGENRIFNEEKAFGPHNHERHYRQHDGHNT